MREADEAEIVVCPECGAEYDKDSFCGECGHGKDEVVEAPKPEPVYARRVKKRAFPVHEAAWCPFCVAWLGTFGSAEEARAYERALTDHPFEFCVKRQAKLNASEEWRLRHEAAKRGSLAGEKPAGLRVPPAGAGA